MSSRSLTRSDLTYPLSHPVGASEKARQLTRIRSKGGLRVEYINSTAETFIMKRGKPVAILKKEKLQGFMPKEIWAAYAIGANKSAGKRIGYADLHKIKDLLKQLKGRL